MSEFDSFEAAREQAGELLGFLASDRVKGFEIPNQSLLSDEAQVRLAQLEFDTESWDRYPTEFTDAAKSALTAKINDAIADVGVDGIAAVMVQVFEDFIKEFPEAAVLTGELKEPHRKNGELVEPYSIQRAKAVMGEDYEAFRRAGGNAADITVTWWKMNKIIADRRAADSKSAGSDQAVAAVPESDSV
ncbi:hypothetical protein LE977_25000 [Mycobacterium avium]|uniref:hypothetical protein n=1 Tax=Mycobacterium avium TaxID=1764 RepID=UPI00293B839B|nr:hypothetical protein [Mycobacterium avium]MDV3219629.1 hypothetical protein [Mycobacterium avium]